MPVKECGHAIAYMSHATHAKAAQSSITNPAGALPRGLISSFTSAVAHALHALQLVPGQNLQHSAHPCQACIPQ